MYTLQCEGCQMGQSSDVLLNEVAAYHSCPLIEVSLYCILNVGKDFPKPEGTVCV